jgi:ubiquinone/menaquinone biosynthesis C-methylase UbiE
MKTTLSFIAATLAACCLALVSTSAQEKSVRPGINKPFENPDLKDFLKKFEGESREIATQAKEIVAACKIKPGMVVADVGAGTGLFTRKFASEVGGKGKVVAVDIAPTFLRHIEKTREDAKIKNVETILCDQFSTKLPKNSVDLVFICDTYHHFEFPQRTLQSMHDALRPRGRVILMDFHRIEGRSSDWVMGHLRAGQEVFVREIKSAGFKVVGEEKLFKENYFVRFEKAVKETPKRTLNDFQKSLDKALTPAETVATFGEPDRKLESGLIIYEYDLEDGTKMRLDFPGLAAIQYAYHVQKDGKFVVIPLK